MREKKKNAPGNPPCERIPAAKVSKPFGLPGEVVISLYDTFPEHVDMDEPFFAEIDSLAVPLYLEKFERRGRSGALVRFADFDTPERVSELLGRELYILSTQSDEEDNDEGVIYLEDFVGFAALFAGKDMQGRIESFIEHEHNPLFSVDIDGSEVLIPATDELIADFDAEARTVTFDLPEGLLELYL